MSIHLMVVAAYLPKELVTTTQKLVLMKIADSADDQTRTGRPGLERMMAWAGVGEKRTTTVVTELIDLGLVERVTVGRSGRRAEYRVFPQSVPPIPSTEELVARRQTAKSRPKNPRLARSGVPRARPRAATRTQQDTEARRTEPSQLETAEESGFPQGNPDMEHGWVPLREPRGFRQGNPQGSPGETPSLPSSSGSLPHPPAPQAGVEKQQPGGCPHHTVPARNCRGCGTSPRTKRELAQEEEAEAARVSQQKWLKDFLAAQRERVKQADSEAVTRAREEARRLARRQEPPPPDS